MKRRNEKWKEWKWEQLIGNEIGDSFLGMIMAGLNSNTIKKNTVTKMNLTSDAMINKEKERRDGGEWGKKWIENQIEDERAKIISESLKTNTSLTELNLECENNKWE